jgi:large subunit ribosomal protein L4
MPTIALLNQSGEKIKDVELSAEVFGIEQINQQVIYDVVNCQRAAMRQGTHDVKNRSEVSGGGKKPWRQKGTGRARQGSIRAPQWRGGGVVFGPTPRSYAFKLNKKVKQLGLKNTLSYMVKQNTLVAVDAIKFEEIKTKNFVKFLNDIKVSGKTVVICSPDELNTEKNPLAMNAYLSANNIDTVMLKPADNASVYEILSCKNLVLTEAAIAYYEEALK